MDLAAAKTQKAVSLREPLPPPVSAEEAERILDSARFTATSVLGRHFSIDVNAQHVPESVGRRYGGGLTVHLTPDGQQGQAFVNVSVQWKASNRGWLRSGEDYGGIDSTQFTQPIAGGPIQYPGPSVFGTMPGSAMRAHERKEHLDQVIPGLFTEIRALADRMLKDVPPGTQTTTLQSGRTRLTFDTSHPDIRRLAVKLVQAARLLDVGPGRELSMR
jgi:hypothetical protein